MPGTCDDAASLATQYAAESTFEIEDMSKEYKDLSAPMCWNAVIGVARLAGIANVSRYPDVLSPDQVRKLVTTGNRRVASAEAMAALPAGQFLAFFEAGKDMMIHAMVSTWSGQAAGTKNNCIGLGKGVWERHDLAHVLHWNDLDGTIEVKGDQGGSRALNLHYRPLTDLPSP